MPSNVTNITHAVTRLICVAHFKSGDKTNEIQADNEEHATAPELLQSAKFHLHCYAYFA